jgi:hypothetical protein
MFFWLRNHIKLLEITISFQFLTERRFVEPKSFVHPLDLDFHKSFLFLFDFPMQRIASKIQLKYSFLSISQN